MQTICPKILVSCLRKAFVIEKGELMYADELSQDLGFLSEKSICNRKRTINVGK